MVYKEIDLVQEIDSELILFRELFTNNTYNRNYLIITQGGRISQHMVELLVRYKKNINYNLYNKTFEEFLDDNDFIPKQFRDYALALQNYRYKALPPSEKEKIELDEIFLSFLESFSSFLFLFRNFFHNNFYSNQGTFFELHKTIDFLSQQITEEYHQKDNKLIEESQYRTDINSMYQFANSIEKMIIKQDALLELNKDMSQKQDAHMEISKETNYNVKQLRKEIKELNKVIINYQERAESLLEDAHSEEEKDEILSHFTDKCVKKIMNCSKNRSDKLYYKQEEKLLIVALGEPAWNKLSEQSKTFLVTSKITYRNLLLLDDIIDYSGVCLLVTKALETELSKRFFKGFVKYLKKQYGDNYSEYHSSLLSQNKKTNHYYLIKPKKCDLGRITCILGFNRFGIKDDEEYEKNISRLVEFSKFKLFKDLTDEEIKDKLFDYGSDVDTIRLNYRNPAAHTNELKKVDADQCFKFVIESEKVLKKMLDSFDRENRTN